ncbi:hypothetical protein IGI43_000792 [Enterococcus sp. AZ126]
MQFMYCLFIFIGSFKNNGGIGMDYWDLIKEMINEIDDIEKIKFLYELILKL